MKRKLTKKQLNALKYLILRSKNAGEETKKACFAMIDASRGLTKPVCYSSQSKDIRYGMHSMQSSNGSTHLNEVMIALGTNFEFSHHSGRIKQGNLSDTREGKYHTIWLSSVEYDYQATEITEEQVKQVKLIDPLYGLEKV